MDKKKKIILLVCIILIAIIAIVLITIKLLNNTNKESLEKIEEDYKTVEYKIDISKDSLFINNREKAYTNYSRKTEVLLYEGTKIYIENNELYYSNENKKEKININNETPKYLEIGEDCGGTYVMALTVAGNIYGINIPGTPTIGPKILYNKNDATEIVGVTESTIFTTCGLATFYALTKDNLIAVPSFLLENEDINNYHYKTREESHPFSVAYSIATTRTYSDDKLLLYPDGSLNKYIYSYYHTDDYANLPNQFVEKQNGEKILVSFAYYLDDLLYIITTDGEIYKITVPEGYEEEDADKKTEPISFKMNKEFTDKKVDFIQLQIQYNEPKRRYNLNRLYQNPELTIHFIDGETKKYSTKSGDKIEVYLTDYFML